MSLSHHLHCSASLAAVTVVPGSWGLIIRDMATRRELAGLGGPDTTSGPPSCRRAPSGRGRAPGCGQLASGREPETREDDGKPVPAPLQPGPVRELSPPEGDLRAHITLLFME